MCWKVSFGTQRLSVIRNSEVVRSSGAENVLRLRIYLAVGTSTVVRYSEEVRYWEGPLSEVSLYTRVIECPELPPRPKLPQFTLRTGDLVFGELKGGNGKWRANTIVLPLEALGFHA